MEGTPCQWVGLRALVVRSQARVSGLIGIQGLELERSTVMVMVIVAVATTEVLVMMIMRNGIK